MADGKFEGFFGSKLRGLPVRFATRAAEIIAANAAGSKATLSGMAQTICTAAVVTAANTDENKTRVARAAAEPPRWRMMERSFCCSSGLRVSLPWCECR